MCFVSPPVWPILAGRVTDVHFCITRLFSKDFFTVSLKRPFLWVLKYGGFQHGHHIKLLLVGIVMCGSANQLCQRKLVMIP